MDPGFPRRGHWPLRGWWIQDFPGGTKPVRGHQPTIRPIVYPQNSLKIKKFFLRGGRPIAPRRSARCYWITIDLRHFNQCKNVDACLSVCLFVCLSGRTAAQHMRRIRCKLSKGPLCGCVMSITRHCIHRAHHLILWKFSNKRDVTSSTCRCNFPSLYRTFCKIRYILKKVLLRERKRHTARLVASDPSVALTGEGVPHRWLGPHLYLVGGYPIPGQGVLLTGEYPILSQEWYPIPGQGVPHLWPSGYPIPGRGHPPHLDLARGGTHPWPGDTLSIWTWLGYPPPPSVHG